MRKFEVGMHFQCLRKAQFMDESWRKQGEKDGMDDAEVTVKTILVRDTIVSVS